MQPPSRGLALAGSIISIVLSSITFLGGIILLSEGPRYADTAGLVTVLFSLPGIILGALGCATKPGPILANAIVMTLFCLLTIVGLGNLGRSDAFAPALFGALIYVTTTVFLYIGFGQAKRYQAFRAQVDVR